MRTKRRTVQAAKRLYRLCLVDGRLDESRARLIAHRIADAHRHGSLAVLSRFQRLVRLDRDQHTAHVESAAPLSTDLRTSLVTSITRMFGPGIEARFVQNSDLIGGVRVTLGSRVYDGSIKGRLHAIGARL